MYVHICMQFAMLAGLINIFMAILMAIHWLITGLLLDDLYDKYCDHVKDGHCNDVDQRFTALSIMSYISVGGWVSVIIA